MISKLHDWAHLPTAWVISANLMGLMDPKGFFEWCLFVLVMAAIVIAAIHAVEATLSIFKKQGNKQ